MKHLESKMNPDDDILALRHVTSGCSIASEFKCLFCSKESQLAQALSNSSDWCLRHSKEAAAKGHLEEEVHDLKLWANMSTFRRFLLLLWNKNCPWIWKVAVFQCLTCTYDSSIMLRVFFFLELARKLSCLIFLLLYSQVSDLSTQLHMSVDKVRSEREELMDQLHQLSAENTSTKLDNQRLKVRESCFIWMKWTCALTGLGEHVNFSWKTGLM